ncbi:unnamed protein product [Phaeothamnion confervicola]
MLLAHVLAFAMGTANAQSDKPVSIIVPFPPGGVVDVVGRLLADGMSSAMGARVIVENRPGAGGTIGATAVAKAAPDGRTLLLGGAATHVFSPLLYPNLAYTPERSFAPVSQVSTGPLVLVLPSGSVVSTMGEFLALAKTQGDRLNYASNGSGTYPHLAAELFRRAVGGKFVHVPYAGGSQAGVALASGEVGFSINHIPVVLPFIKSGKVRAIATTGTKRSASFPDLPTFGESGLKGYEASPWFGVFAPAGTPPAAIDKLSGVITKVVTSGTFRERLAAYGDEAVGGSPQELDALLRSELAKWPTVVRDAEVKAN